MHSHYSGEKQEIEYVVFLYGWKCYCNNSSIGDDVVEKQRKREKSDDTFHLMTLELKIKRQESI